MAEAVLVEEVGELFVTKMRRGYVYVITDGYFSMTITARNMRSLRAWMSNQPELVTLPGAPIDPNIAECNKNTVYNDRSNDRG